MLISGTEIIRSVSPEIDRIKATSGVQKIRLIMNNGDGFDPSQSTYNSGFIGGWYPFETAVETDTIAYLIYEFQVNSRYRSQSEFLVKGRIDRRYGTYYALVGVAGGRISWVSSAIITREVYRAFQNEEINTRQFNTTVNYPLYRIGMYCDLTLFSESTPRTPHDNWAEDTTTLDYIFSKQIPKKPRVRPIVFESSHNKKRKIDVGIMHVPEPVIVQPYKPLNPRTPRKPPPGYSL